MGKSVDRQSTLAPKNRVTNKQIDSLIFYLLTAREIERGKNVISDKLYYYYYFEQQLSFYR